MSAQQDDISERFRSEQDKRPVPAARSINDCVGQSGGRTQSNTERSIEPNPTDASTSSMGQKYSQRSTSYSGDSPNGLRTHNPPGDNISSSPLPKPRLNQQSSSAELTLFNSDYVSQTSTHSKHSIASNDPVFGPTEKPTSLSSKHSMDGSLTRNRTDKSSRNQSYDGGNENYAAATATNQNDNQLRLYPAITDRLDSKASTSTSLSKRLLVASKSYDEADGHRAHPPSTPPSTPEVVSKQKSPFFASPSHLFTSEENDESKRRSVVDDRSRIEQTKIIPSPSDTHQRYPYERTSSRTYDDNTSNSSPSTLPRSSSREYPIVAYIPSLPSTIEKLKLRITSCLYQEHKFQIIDIKCSSQLDVGIIYLKDENEKHHLVNNIKNITVSPDSNEIVSFVAELELISYVFIRSKDSRNLPLANEIAQQWAKTYDGNCPANCEYLSDEFRNIFRIVTKSFSEFVNKAFPSFFWTDNQLVEVYFRADCCFLENLPTNFNESNLKSVIAKQINNKDISSKSIYIQYNQTEANAVVLTRDEARSWASFRLINLDGHYIVKIDQLFYQLRIPNAPGSISISSLENSEMFAGTGVKVRRSRGDIILDLSDKRLFEKCLQKRTLDVENYQLRIEAYSSSTHYEDWEINGKNWYETEMSSCKSDIMQFICEPEHPIFRFKWNPEAFLEQLRRWSAKPNSNATNQRDLDGNLSNRQRHLIRMTVMLNTIGVLKQGSYYTINKEVKLKSKPLKTIVYNHQSKLQRATTISNPMKYPYKITSVSVINQDCLVAYEDLLSKGHRPLLLNMANAFSPGGGYRKGDGAQEENIFRRSNYYRSLDMDLDDGKPADRVYCTINCDTKPLIGGEKMYPMDEFGAIYTSGLTVFRQPENNGYDFMDTPVYDVCAIAIAAYRNPRLDRDDKNLLSKKYSIKMRKKIENIFAIAHHHNHDCLVLSAFGCGAFRNPPTHVAKIFKSVIKQYAGFFEHIYFAIIDDHNTGLDFNPNGNYRPFQEVLDKVQYKPVRQEMPDMMIGPWRILNKTNNDDIVLDDVRIWNLQPCHYGGQCRDLDKQQHCREYMHPPLCPYTDSSRDCKSENNNDHMLWFRHKIKCSYSDKCRLTDDPVHMTHYEHPKISRDDRGTVGMHQECTQYGGDVQLSKDNDSTSTHNDVRKRKTIIKEVNEFPATCPFTPFHCQQYNLLSQSTDIEKLPLDVRDHCSRFLHVCRLGRQCCETLNSHLEKTIHVARNICPDGERCSKLHQDDHLGSLSHAKIDDIRVLCIFPAYECQDFRKPEHTRQFRHCGNFDNSSVIQYCELNKRINFLQNQQTIVALINDYAKKLPLRASLSIPTAIPRFIRKWVPIYQCSKGIFELILAHGHVMSNKTIEELQMPNLLIQTIQRNKQIESIANLYKNKSILDHINNYIKAIFFIEYNRRVCQTKPTITNERSTTCFPPSTTTSDDADLNDTIRTEEKYLKEMLSQKEVDIIRRSTITIVQVSLDSQMHPGDLRKTPNESFSPDKHICTIFGPQLRCDHGDIVLVFKRKVMLHPDANFCLQSEDAFLNGNAFMQRPWMKDSGSFHGRMKQLQEAKLHCSIVGHDYAAAADLMATIGLRDKTMNVDLNAIMKHLKSINSNTTFEGHLPDFIPLDYIGEVYIPKNLFQSLSSPAQMAARSIFGDSLRITNHEVNLSPQASGESRSLEKSRVEYQQYVIDKLFEVSTLDTEPFQELSGIVITLPPSHFLEHVPLPYTIEQIYDYYIQSQNQNSISDEIYIYWQAMYGDMMLTLSTEPLASIDNRQRTKCLVCYIAGTPSTTPTDYRESYTYLNLGDPLKHEYVMNKRSFLANSNTFHRGCNLDGFLLYCLKLQRDTGQVTLSHAGPNSIYSYETVSYMFSKSDLKLNDLNFIHVSAGSHQVPVRNLMVHFHPIHDFHPAFDQYFKSNNSPPIQPAPHNPDRARSAAAAKPAENNAQSIISKLNQFPGGSRDIDIDRRKIQPCRDSINCLKIISEEHCKRFSHPCRFSEVCRNKDREPNLTHEPHRVSNCSLGRSCKKLDDPYHRAAYRHVELPDFLFPCRDQNACKNRTFEHRVKYSHGEKLERKIINEDPDKPRSFSNPSSSESYLDDQRNPRNQQHQGHDENRNEKLPCRYGLKCRDRNIAHHCSRYSHPSNQDKGRKPCPFGSTCYNTTDAKHISEFSHG
ncbi:unnamed protein product [Rotaria magnacalcarata]